MTDKATVEMTAPVSGRLVEMAGEVGKRIAIGSILAVFETKGGEAATSAAPPKAEVIDIPAEAAQPLEPTPAPPATIPDETPAPAVPSKSAETRIPASRILASPAVRQRAKSLAIELADVRSSSDGRIRHSDLEPSSTTTIRPVMDPQAARKRMKC